MELTLDLHNACTIGGGQPFFHRDLDFNTGCQIQHIRQDRQVDYGEQCQDKVLIHKDLLGVKGIQHSFRFFVFNGTWGFASEKFCKSIGGEQLEYLSSPNLMDFYREMGLNNVFDITNQKLELGWDMNVSKKNNILLDS